MTTITKHYQVSIPVRLRREMRLTPGQSVLWKKVSGTECLITFPQNRQLEPNPVAALNFAREHGLESMPTADWMKLIRGDEDA